MLYSDSDIQIIESDKKFPHSTTIRVFFIKERQTYLIAFFDNEVIKIIHRGQMTTIPPIKFKNIFPYGSTIFKFVDNIMFK